MGLGIFRMIGATTDAVSTTVEGGASILSKTIKGIDGTFTLLEVTGNAIDQAARDLEPDITKAIGLNLANSLGLELPATTNSKD